MGQEVDDYTPSQDQLDYQDDFYRSQWDLEQDQKDAKELLDTENARKKRVKTELQSRKGVKDVLTGGVKGYTKNEESIDGGFL